MTVYAKKNAHGQLTGQWMVELTVAGRRIRETCPDEDTARRRQVEIRANPPATPLAPASDPLAPALGYTVAQLRKDALPVWKDTKDQTQSIRRFETVCDILIAAKITYLSAVRTSQLDMVVDTLRSQSLSNKTIHRYLAAFSGACRWAVTRDKLVGMPTFPWPKCGKGNDTVISEVDERRVFAYLKKTGSPDVALVVDGLLATGCRISEMLRLEPADIKVRTGELTEIRFKDTKNGDDRLVYVEDALGRRLAALAAVGFPTYRRINTVLHRARKALKIEHKVLPHVMRHTVGTRLDDAGMSAKAIGTLLGHRSINTTMGYIHTQQNTLKRAATHLRRPGAGTPNMEITPKATHTGPFGRPQAEFVPEPQVIDFMEASPRIELGCKDLQCHDDLSEVPAAQVLPESNNTDGLDNG